MKSILVTGIGGVVGQGILRNLRAMGVEIEIIGTNTQLVSAGNHLCDHVYQLPFAFEKGYIVATREIIQRHNVALVIPSTDYEAYHLSLNRAVLQTTVAASPPDVAMLCLDKYKNYREFSKIGLPFAASILPSVYAGEFEKTIVKPREGRGSRNIHVNPSFPATFGDDYLVQEYLDGPELTTAFYVLQTGDLHGFISLERQLEQGNTSRCEVTFEYDVDIREILRKIISHYSFRGSCNIQTRVTKNGIIPFEINCRISGTNSIRAQFGFNDVAYTVQELLLDQQVEKPKITGGSALRIIHDVIYPEKSLAGISNCKDHFWIF